MRHDTRRHPVAVIWTAVVLVFTIVPIVYLLSVSLMSRSDIASGVLFPANPQFDNWVQAFANSNVLPSIASSLGVAVGGAVLTLLIALPAAWTMVRHNTGGAGIANLIVSPWLLPPIVAVIPLFFLLRVLGLSNSLLGLTLVYALMNVPVAVWLLEGFLRKLPIEIEEAAQIDGAGTLRLLASIVVPLLAPALVSIGIIVGILNYNEFLLATFFLQDPDSQTLPVTLSLYYGDRIPHLGRMAAASLIGAIPIFVVAAFLQRRLLSGLAAVSSGGR